MQRLRGTHLNESEQIIVMALRHCAETGAGSLDDRQAALDFSNEIRRGELRLVVVVR